MSIPVKRRSVLQTLGAVSAALAASAVVRAQGAGVAEWPQRTVTIVTPFAPGISVDVAARVTADTVSKRWGQPVVVDNKPGADTMIGTRAFLDKRDGHTLLFTTHSTFTVVPLLYDNVPYDAVNDVSPVSLVVEDFLAVVAAPSLPVKSLAEFVALARAAPGKMNYYAVPGTPQLAYLAFQKSTGLETTYVGYTNPTGAVSDLAEGRIQVAIMPLALVLGTARSGTVKLLAVTNGERAPVFPDVPTAKESGYAALSFGGLLGLFGPRDMPVALQQKIAWDVSFILKDPLVRQRLLDAGLVPRGSSPAEFVATLEAQRTKWATIAREHNITPQRPR